MATETMAIIEAGGYWSLALSDLRLVQVSGMPSRAPGCACLTRYSPRSRVKVLGDQRPR